MPLISVIMPVYNCEKYITDAVKSILNQTLSDFELLIINDQSTDSTYKYLTDIKDSRITLINLKKHRGIVYCLNKGMKIAQGKYIFRMDGDDVSIINRFEETIKFFDKNPKIGIVGTYIKVIGNKFSLYPKYFLLDKELKTQLFFETCFAHPSVAFRRKIVEKYNLQYEKEYEFAEDYRMWIRFKNFTKFAVIPKVLILYRLHNSQICRKNNIPQSIVLNKICIEQLISCFGNVFSLKEKIAHEAIIRYKIVQSIEKMIEIKKWVEKLIELNYKTKVFDIQTFNNLIYNRWNYLVVNYITNMSNKKVKEAFFLSYIKGARRCVSMMGIIKLAIKQEILKKI